MEFPPQFDRSPGIQSVKIAVLGDRGVGKTSLVRQFVYNTFSDHYNPTPAPLSHYSSLIINDHVYEATIMDFPMITYFPANVSYDWSDDAWGYYGYSLRHATAYILVFDVANEESFQHVRSLREQILDSRGGSGPEVPLLVVGNKHDLGEDRFCSQRRDTATVIKKHWKCSYIECSAKFNWHVVSIFKELMKQVDNVSQNPKPSCGRVPQVLRHNTCHIL